MDTFLSPPPVAGTYHGCSSRSLVDLVLGCFDLHLQVSWRVEIFALLPRAAALNVVHTHSDGVVVGVDHRAVRRVGEAAVVLPACAVAPLVFATHLQMHIFTALRFIVSDSISLKNQSVSYFMGRSVMIDQHHSSSLHSFDL